MNCTTIRKGEHCTFMTTAGCSYNSGACLEIVEQCTGCGRILTFETGSFCATCPEPAKKWKNGICNLATHVKIEVTKEAQKLNPLKASKRGK